MNEKRKGEIALAVLRDQARQNGLRLSPRDVKREWPNLSERTGIPLEELKEFGEEEAKLLVKEIFEN